MTVAMGVRWGAWALVWALQAVMVATSTRLKQGADLSFFVSRPDLRAPKMTVKTYDNAAEIPSYIFTAPYTRLIPTVADIQLYDPAQSGPHIYDNRGELVWSGGELTNNLVVTDFRPILIDGKHHLSFAVREDNRATGLEQRTGYIVDSRFHIVKYVDMTRDFDIHEFKILNNATSFLKVLSREESTDKLIPGETITVMDNCAVEADFSGTEIFKFCALEKLGLDEPIFQRPDDDVLRKKPWDLYHMNSVEKFSNGDYLVSIRYTNAIYRISPTGSVIWRLGGKLSDFKQDFTFSGQHDARIVSENDTVLVISFLDNASADHEDYMQTADVSSFKVVALYEHETGGRAELLKSFHRPDGNLTRLRGSGHYHSSGGAFVSWSDQGYATEFAPDGHLVQEARFVSPLLSTYRAYKADFVGTPDSLPALRTFRSLDDRGNVLLISYVSWNGATEVATWEFFGSDEEEGEYKLLGRVPRTTFETTFVAHSSYNYARAVARDAEGNILGESATVETDPSGSIVGGIQDTKSGWKLGEHWESTDRSSRALLLGSTVIVAALVLGLIIRCMRSVSTHRRFRRILWPFYSDRHGYVPLRQEMTAQC